MFAKDGMNKIGQVQQDSIIFDNVNPDNTSALAVAGTADNGSGYFVFTNYTSSSTAVMDVPSFYGDNGSSLIGYVLNDNATAPTSLGGFDNSSEWTTINSSGNTALYLHAIDAAYNTNTETVNVFVDQDSPVFSGSVGFTASYGGSDNSTHVLVSGTSDGSVTLTFTATFTDGGGIAGYYVSETQAVTTQLSADNFSANGLTYTLTDVSSYTTTQDKTFYIYAVDNIGQIAAAPAKTIKIVPEARATDSTYASTDSVRALTGPAVDEFVLNGYTNGDNQTTVDNGSVINGTSFDMRLSVSSDTTPVYGWRVSCEDVANTTSAWTDKGNYTRFDATAITAMMANDNDSFNYDNFTETLDLSSITGCGTSGGTKAIKDGERTIYVGLMSQGGTVSTIASDKITIDTTLPIIDNFTLKDLNADNSTHSTGAIIRSLLDFSDNNTTTSSLTDNGTGVAYYIVSENGTTPAFNDSRWLSVDNQTSHNDNFTIVTQTTNPGDTVTIYAWVKDNATNISARSTQTITIKADSSAPVINGFYINNASPAGDNATYINNKDNVSLYISAWDTDSGITDYYLSTDNGSPSESEWTAFAATTDNFTDNVSNLDLDNFPAVTLAPGNNTLYLWVRNSQDNVTKAGTTVGVDTFILDTTAPSDNDTPRLTGSVASVSNQDNQTYTTTLTVTLDNVSLWADDNTTTPANAVSGVYAYYLSDNGTTAPTVSSSWQTLDNLTLSLDNSSTWEGVNILNDNNSVGNKTIYVWYRDEAFNIASTAKSVSIFFDNETPDWSGVGYTLHDADGSSGNYTLDNLYTNAATITIDNVTAYDNESGHVGSGIWQYFFTDNQTTAEALRDNTSNTHEWATVSDSYNLTLDNKTNRLVTIYGYVKDRAGNISAADNTTISFDNASPVIDNVTLAAGFSFSGSPTNNLITSKANSATIQLYLSANDNESSGAANYSSGWQSVRYVYSVTGTNRIYPFSGISTVISEKDSGWLSMDNLTTVTSDNFSFDNATFTLSLVPDNTSTFIYLDNGTDTKDNLTVTVWIRDNASNEDNFTTVFSLDNSTSNIWYTPNP
jgi:hypothetical protein